MTTRGFLLGDPCHAPLSFFSQLTFASTGSLFRTGGARGRDEADAWDTRTWPTLAKAGKTEIVMIRGTRGNIGIVSAREASRLFNPCYKNRCHGGEGYVARARTAACR